METEVSFEMLLHKHHIEYCLIEDHISEYAL